MTEPRNTNLTWQLWIDTGGTFTDCVAIDPWDNLHRAKVLSSGALRGRIVKQLDSHTFEISTGWIVPDDFLIGFELRILDGSESTEGDSQFGINTQICGYDAGGKVISITDDLPDNFYRRLADDKFLDFEAFTDEEAPILAARLVTGTPVGQILPAINMRLATTRGTNALLERKGSDIAFFVTAGFADLITIGNQQRNDLFTCNIQKPKPLYKAVIEVGERVAADGSVIKALDCQELDKQVTDLLNKGIMVAAIALMNSYKNAEHELRLAEYLLRSGFDHVSVSSGLATFIKILHRAETTIVNAYLSLTIESYLSNIDKTINAEGKLIGDSEVNTYGESDSKLLVMTSAGGLMGADSYHPKDSLLSGPAGGVTGAAAAGKLAGFSRIIAFDMGGTSTDVARFDGDYEYVFEHTIGDAHLAAPALAIETVAAGGGSICWYDGQALKVGPDSAGADPGPACYGKGGPLTITDVNLLLGRLNPEMFEIPIRVDGACKRFTELVELVNKDRLNKMDDNTILQGFVEIANERMAEAIRRISVRRGFELKDYALVAFGGAGAMHACGVAGILGIKKIIIPRDAGLLSAVGLGNAVVERFAQKQILRLLDEFKDIELNTILEDLQLNAVELVCSECKDKSFDDIIIRRQILNLRLAGQESTISIDYDSTANLIDIFVNRYQQMYGHEPGNRAVELESIRVIAATKPVVSDLGICQHDLPQQDDLFENTTINRTGKAYFDNEWLDVAVYNRRDISRGFGFSGPALILESHATSVIDSKWDGTVDNNGGAILLTYQPDVNESCSVNNSQITHRDNNLRHDDDGDVDIIQPDQLELFTNRLGAITEQMGDMLCRTALSTNVKERLDFSCALLDREGYLVVNAPHIPVHLGALGLCVRRVLELLGELGSGDIVITNHPAYGGSHLPDITIITPVFGGSDSRDRGGSCELLGYVASRAHHAEIGGDTPGSMSPQATCLAQEGVVIYPQYLVQSGVAHWDRIERLLSESHYPSRCVEDNIADIRAAVAANQKGVMALRELAEVHSARVIMRYMGALKDKAELLVRQMLSAMDDGEYKACEYLDDGSALCVTARVSGDEMEIDFVGSAGTHAGNLNATPAIVRSAVIYVLRLLVNKPLPLNEGLIRPVTVRLPFDSILDPVFCDDCEKSPAVAGGNVETSQRIVDTLIKAFGLAACSQGTMNNVIFGNDHFGYYETICGGAGAGEEFAGADAVHTHMTNTRITDPEILEHRYPVRLDRFAVRPGSGGSGKYAGGNGVVRELTFLQPVSLSVLTQHRKEVPYGLAGGKPGKAGSQYVIRGVSGEIVNLEAVDCLNVSAGDRLVIKTPGGGGFGNDI